MTYILFISVRKQFNFFTSILKRFFNKTFFVQVGTTIHLCKKLKDTKNVHIRCDSKPKSDHVYQKLSQHFYMPCRHLDNEHA